MQAAQVEYERVLVEGPADGAAAAEAETAMSKTHAAYDAYLTSFAGKLGS